MMPDCNPLGSKYGGKVQNREQHYGVPTGGKEAEARPSSTVHKLRLYGWEGTEYVPVTWYLFRAWLACLAVCVPERWVLPSHRAILSWGQWLIMHNSATNPQI